MLTMDLEAVKAALPWAKLGEALEAVFREGCEAPLRHFHPLPQEEADQGSLLLMPAWLPHRYTGVKIVHVAPGNAVKRLPAVNAVYILSNGETGEPLAMLHGGELTDRRTAAASVLAARYLARPDSRRLLVVGAGKVARAAAEAYAQAFDLAEITLWARRLEAAEAAAAELRAHGLPVTATDRLNPAGFDIVTAATLSTTPLIKGAEVSPGTHIDLIGAFRPTMRESDGALLARATVTVDTMAGGLAEAGDVVQAIAEGAIGKEHVVADLFALTRGTHPGRTSAEEITLFKSVGWAGEDLAAAALAYETARG
ncbi:ornithine cyclodeaminase family protein [Acetobacteraceae bacterium H6797]|nr:ornithine cyclodeaminase family protein [Acetobacteraceae bacterium H6797]